MIQLSWTIFIIQLVSSFMMIGIVWLVQVINYPLFKSVPESLFKEYHRSHLARSQWLIAPLMLTELVSAAYLLLWPIAQVRYSLYVSNFLLIVLIWILTFFMQIPTHRLLQEKYSQAALESLISWNWARTILWNVHGLILIFILY